MKSLFRWAAALLIVSLASAAGAFGQANPAAPSFASKTYEAISLFGRPLVSPAPSPAAVKSYEEALKNFAADPSEDNWIWLGRRAAYLGRFREAIAVYSEGLKKHPDSYRLYRHRGHRYITIRQFGRAIADFEKAAALAAGKPLEVEADGNPNQLMDSRDFLTANGLPVMFENAPASLIVIEYGVKANTLSFSDSLYVTIK